MATFVSCQQNGLESVGDYAIRLEKLAEGVLDTMSDEAKDAQLADSFV